MYYRRKHQKYCMKYLSIIFLLTGLAACKSKLPEGWVKDPFKKCAPEEQVIALLASRDWVLDKVEGKIKQSEIEWFQEVLYTYKTDIDLFSIRPCYTLETYPNKGKNYLAEISDKQVFYIIIRPKYFMYYLISNDRLVDEPFLDVYLYYTGQPRN